MIAIVAALIGLLAAPAVTIADATDAAVFLLRQTLRPQPDDRHHELIRALRRLEDPTLRPLFERLATSALPELKIQGILALAELDPDRRLDLARVAEIADPGLQSDLLTHAMDADLLTLDTARELMAWSGLDPAVRLLVAVPLVAEGEAPDTTALHEALRSDKLGRAGLAALLLHQLDDPAGMDGLLRLDRSPDARQRELARMMLLRTALRHDFARAASWAYAVSTESQADPALRLYALRVAMRFGHDRATDAWRQRFAATGDLAGRIRLGMIALRLSPWLEPDVFDAFEDAGDPMLAQLGRTGAAIASGQPDAADRVVELVRGFHHPLLSRWAVDYATEHAEPADAAVILMAVIMDFAQGPAPGRAQRLELLVNATEQLVQTAPEHAAALLRPILTDQGTDRLTKRGVLTGLARATPSEAAAIVEGLPAMGDTHADQLLTLLKARGEAAMPEGALDDLATLVRGGGRLGYGLRAQAAWAWLRRTGRADQTLTRVLQE